MLKLKKIALIGASALALSAVTAVSTQAQPWRGHAPVYGSDSGRLTTSYVDGLDFKITNAARYRVISWDEARDLRNQLHSVQTLAWKVQTGQANNWEYRRLDNTVSRIEAAINRYAANDRRYDNRRYDDYRDYRR
jgi:hypothetical protein